MCVCVHIFAVLHRLCIKTSYNLEVIGGLMCINIRISSKSTSH